MSIESRINRQIKAPQHLFRAGAHIGFESTLAKELSLFGISSKMEIGEGVVYFNSKLENVWNAQVVSRCARNFEMQIAKFHCENFGRLEHEIKSIAWELYLPENCNLQIKAFCEKSRLYHQKAIEERVLNAITAHINCEPSALALNEDNNQSQTITVRLKNDICTIWQDLSGEPLYKRTERWVENAPLQETLAASILLYADFAKYETLIDPMAGSGIFSLEAAAWRFAKKPGNRNFSVMHTPAFRPAAYKHFLENYKSPFSDSPTANGTNSCSEPPLSNGENSSVLASEHAISLDVKNAQFHILTSDIDSKSVRTIERNAKVLELENYIKPKQADFFSLPSQKNALLVLNPPYGKRLAKNQALYREIAKKITRDFKECSAIILAPQGENFKAPFTEAFKTFNGGIKISIFRYIVSAD